MRSSHAFFLRPAATNHASPPTPPPRHPAPSHSGRVLDPDPSGAGGCRSGLGRRRRSTSRSGRRWLASGCHSATALPSRSARGLGGRSVLRLRGRRGLGGRGRLAGLRGRAAAGREGGMEVAAWDRVFDGVGDSVGASLVGASVVGASVGVSGVSVGFSLGTWWAPWWPSLSGGTGWVAHSAGSARASAVRRIPRAARSGGSPPRRIRSPRGLSGAGVRRLSLHGGGVRARLAPAVVGTESTPSVPAGRWESPIAGVAATSRGERPRRARRRPAEAQWAARVPDGPLHGVSDGTRTRDHRDHNQVLYQLSYTHHVRAGSLCGRWKVYPTQAGGSDAEVLTAWSTTWFVAAARA